MKDLPAEFGALITVRNRKTGEDTVFCRIGKDPEFPWVGQLREETAVGEYFLNEKLISGWSYINKRDPEDLIERVQEETGLTLLEEDARVILDFFSEGRAT